MVLRITKDGKRSNLSSDSLKKHSILWISAHLEGARTQSINKCSNKDSDKFTDGDNVYSEWNFFVLYLLLWYLLILFSSCCRFDQELEKCGIDISPSSWYNYGIHWLDQGLWVEITMEYIGGTKDWEKELKRKNFPVV